MLKNPIVFLSPFGLVGGHFCFFLGKLCPRHRKIKNETVLPLRFNACKCCHSNLDMYMNPSQIQTSLSLSRFEAREEEGRGGGAVQASVVHEGSYLLAKHPNLPFHQGHSTSDRKRVLRAEFPGPDKRKHAHISQKIKMFKRFNFQCVCVCTYWQPSRTRNTAVTRHRWADKRQQSAGK
jgi:hypothetical protein